MWSTATRRVLRNAARPGYLPVMANKVLTRVRERPRSGRRADSWAWCAAHATRADDLANSVSAPDWGEAKQVGSELERAAPSRLPRGAGLGGGGHYPLAYFLARQSRAQVVVETGVAAGWTSAAILRALDREACGHLWSSDFPYFRIDQPEAHIGCMVDDHLRARWSLFTAGDRKNLPQILHQLPAPIDLLLYDSDKSYAGREWAMALLDAHLSPAALVLMDDIQDNSYFADLVARTGWTYFVFEFNGYFAGLTGPGCSALFSTADGSA